MGGYFVAPFINLTDQVWQFPGYPAQDKKRCFGLEWKRVEKIKNFYGIFSTLSSKKFQVENLMYSLKFSTWNQSSTSNVSRIDFFTLF
jgi:hypothetical protein